MTNPISSPARGPCGTKPFIILILGPLKMNKMIRVLRSVTG